MQIPVIILNWNGAADTVKCVESVLAQSYSDVHIYLLDNNSAPADCKVIATRYFNHDQVTLVLNNSNLGFGKAHNECLERHIFPKNYEYVAFLNNDAFAEPNWLQNALSHLKEKKADAVACRMLNFFDDSKLDSAGLYMLNTGEILPRGHGDDANSYKEPEEVIGFCAGACLLRTEALKDVGLFDDFFHTGYEDAELSLRFFVKGKRIVYAPNSVVRHKISVSLNKVADKEKAVKIQRDIHYTLYKVLPSGLRWRYLPAYLFRTSLLLGVHLLLFRLTYISVWLMALKHFYGGDLRIARERKVKRIRTKKEIRKHIVSFWKADLKRFRKYILKGQRNQFEKMSENKREIF